MGSSLYFDLQQYYLVHQGELAMVFLGTFFAANLVVYVRHAVII